MRYIYKSLHLTQALAPTTLYHLHQLGGSAANGELPCLLDLGLEDNLVAIPPHLSDERLARHDSACEADLDVLESTEPIIRLASLQVEFVWGHSPLVDGLASNAKEAQTVQDRGLEAAHLCEARVDVQRAIPALATGLT